MYNNGVKSLIQDFIWNYNKHVNFTNKIFDVIVQSLSLQINHFSQLEFKLKLQNLKALSDVFNVIKLKCVSKNSACINVSVFYVLIYGTDQCV